MDPAAQKERDDSKEQAGQYHPLDNVRCLPGPLAVALLGVMVRLTSL